MSKFESREKRESLRFDTEWIKFKVKIALFFFKTIERPISIKGHAYYQMDAKRHYVIISFSK